LQKILNEFSMKLIRQNGANKKFFPASTFKNLTSSLHLSIELCRIKSNKFKDVLTGGNFFQGKGEQQWQ